MPWGGLGGEYAHAAPSLVSTLRRLALCPDSPGTGQPIRAFLCPGSSPKKAFCLEGLRHLLNDLGQFAGRVALGHLGQRNRLDLACIACRAELLVALLADFLGGLTGRLQVFARIDRSEEHTSELQSLMRISY